MRRLLIVGCGDIALRALPALRSRYRIYALTRSHERVSELRAHGVVPIVGDLDDPASLGALAGLAHDVLHCAPPATDGGPRDLRTAHLIAALARGGSLPQHLVYISTSGVYGDCGGEWVSETRPLRPSTERARRRADAERQLRAWGRRSGVCISLLRAPGIYSGQRLPLDRLKAGTPALRAAEDVYTNHVHADDLARMTVAALWFGGSGRAYNASDDSRFKMGEYFDLVADHCGLPRPPRISRAEAERRVLPVLLSFMNESRRLINHRIKRELRLKLRYPTVHDGITGRVAAGE
ncbi:MAG TPA: NAD(P)H-binding protein [Burkholderiales bacterium]|nr:NAD(P)H-binding protein [Burkholderiales bacterium]